MMNETEFREGLADILRDRLHDFSVKTKKSILYKIIIDVNGKIQPENLNEPKRGQYAFETDILISKKDLKMVVIETKYNGFSTHDILTYSNKAIKHKEVYPYLRYGLIVGGQRTIDKKIFIHNVGFDFAIAIEKIEDDIDLVIRVVKDQIQTSDKISKLLSGRSNLPKIINSYSEIE